MALLKINLPLSLLASLASQVRKATFDSRRALLRDITYDSRRALLKIEH